MADPRIGSPGVLVDTSVWVRFFRFGQSSEALHLGGLIQAAAVSTCAPIRAEVLSGARTQPERSKLRELFSAVELLELPSDLWDRVEEMRFALARKGHQAALADLMIALAASVHQAPLWTLDEDFGPIQEVVAFQRYLPAPG